VGHTAGELSERFHFLRLAQLTLQMFALDLVVLLLGQVGEHGDGAGKLPAEYQRTAGDADGKSGTVLRHQFEFVAVGISLLAATLGRENDRDLILGHHAVLLLADQFVRCVTEHAASGRVHELEYTVVVRDNQTLAHAADDRPVEFGEALQLGAGVSGCQCGTSAVLFGVRGAYDRVDDRQ